ncbi:PIN domain nuclease [Crocosphaera sp.]|uniref:type II toxin-antitoxin system VapC family toxin n=1 Tax=Crocosphaera sp. TaxID=2729996 RepID=UPI002611C064|nr:PIN domain nuclease [Crocosphaera sp.]MDJ0579114.1 PIN domain nuclease [Crocosphaera sp.]
MVDSSVWIDYFNGHDTSETRQLDLLLGMQPISIGDIILTEVLQGFRNDSDYNVAKNLLTSLTIFDLLGRNMAVKSAENYRQLRKKGITIRKTTDVIIASFCIENSLPLLFSDKDFLPFVKYLNLLRA